MQGNDPTSGWSPDRPPLSGGPPPPPGAPPPPPPGVPPPPGDQPSQQPSQSWQQPAAGGSPPPGPQLRPLNLGDVLDGSFRILTRNWRTFVIALGVFLVPVSLLAAVAQNLSTGGVGLMSLVFDPAALEAASAAQGSSALTLLQIGVSLAQGILLTPYLTGVCCVVAADTWLRGQRPGPVDVLRRAGRRYWALVGALLLIYLAAVAVVAPGVAVLVAGLIAENVALAVLGGFLVFALSLAAAAIALLFTLAPPAVVLEDAGPVQSLRRSWRLMRQRFWPRVGAILLLLLIVYTVAGILGGVIGAIGGLVGGVVGIVLLTISGLISGIITTPLLSAGTTLVYLDGRIRSEGLDLQAQVEQLGGPPPGASSGG